MLTVVIAFTVNILVAVAKSVAAAITGSASLVAEAAHSWADAGNEVFLLIAERRGARGRDKRHPFGYGRETYIWSMFAAFGLFTVGAVVSVMHGVSALRTPEEGSDYVVGYAVLAIAFVLEGISLLQSVRQARRDASRWSLRPMRYILVTSKATLRAVFAEDAAALIGLILAALGMMLHQLTGSAVWDAAGSIAVGLLLGVVAVILIWRNGEFLLGQAARPDIRHRMLTHLLAHDDVQRVTYLHAEFVGPGQFYVVAAVDLVGDAPEHDVARRLRRLEARLEGHYSIVEAVLTLSTEDEPSLVP
ncbi:cation diffusion facilitator family transporter [Gordonia sp. TBRC 11910]|uniref:Cation diffusion facilitator family transporter n=1 Tax=Gordonia asplenii TaxID=2725283 RepID=A0A848L0G4_9ACTN|nr:cation diffusion facilitator family transporter [Gordonia asplenii]NMO03962.1 cation diffusion facilitator family transporter [Gordonia asplenii]